MRISSPPTTHSCFYGIDTPERGKLLAARHSVDEMAQLIGADSLAFISIDGLYAPWASRPRPGDARILRCLLHRRLPDRAAGHEHRRGAAAQPAARAIDGRVAFVTGASRGIGAAAAVALARRGVHVVITARTQGGLEETDDAIRAAGGTATLLPLDLLDGDALDTVGPSLLERFGRLDILVHAAGALGRLTPAPHILPQDFATTTAVNWRATWRLIRTCGPLLQAAEAGRAVFLTDSAGGGSARLLGPVWRDQGRRCSIWRCPGRGDAQHDLPGQPVRPRHRRAPGCGPKRCPARRARPWCSRATSQRTSPGCANRAKPGTARSCGLLGQNSPRLRRLLHRPIVAQEQDRDAPHQPGRRQQQQAAGEAAGRLLDPSHRVGAGEARTGCPPS